MQIKRCYVQELIYTWQNISFDWECINFCRWLDTELQKQALAWKLRLKRLKNDILFVLNVVWFLKYVLATTFSGIVNLTTLICPKLYHTHPSIISPSPLFPAGSLALLLILTGRDLPPLFLLQQSSSSEDEKEGKWSSNNNILLQQPPLLPQTHPAAIINISSHDLSNVAMEICWLECISKPHHLILSWCTRVQLYSTRFYACVTGTGAKHDMPVRPGTHF